MSTAFQAMHFEDVKAAIRKRHGSLRKFQLANGLPENAVSDVFRGRTSRRTQEAIEKLLAEETASMNLDDKAKRGRAHRLIAEVR